MGEKTVTTWTCDRCGVEEVLDRSSGGVHQPAHWSTFLFVSPARAALSEAKTIGVLCNECGGLAVSFIKNDDEKEIKRAREISRMIRETHRLGGTREGVIVLDAAIAQDLLLLAQRLDQPQYQRATKQLQERLAEMKSE